MSSTTSASSLSQGSVLFALSALATYCLNKSKAEGASPAATTYDFILQNIHQTVTVSCPGKVLIAGGYLVLERPNVGVTIAGTSRFFTTVKCFPQADPSATVLKIVVDSPQFYEQYEYSYDYEKDVISIAPHSPGNTFVEKCLYMSLTFVKHYIGIQAFQDTMKILAKRGYLGIKLRADNDFYSHSEQLLKEGKPLLSSSLEEIPAFAPCSKDKDGNVVVAKTGLGSSAALTTSLVGALLQWFGVIRLGYRWTDDDLRVVHNVSQLVHANAQGKIGSGFDVSSAVYGTQVYQRFSQEPFTKCLEGFVPGELIYKTIVVDAANWNQEVIAFNLPQHLDIVLGDVCGGSSSSSMAKAVLDWKKKSPAAGQLWNELADTNLRIYDGFQQLNKCSTNGNSYSEAISWAAENPVEDWVKNTNSSWKKTLNTLSTLHTDFLAARRLLKSMGDNAGVEIEPDQQTALADSTMSLNGVLCAGVPGAGGHDALFAIVLSTKARSAVEHLWSTKSVCPLLLKAADKHRSGIQPEFEISW